MPSAFGAEVAAIRLLELSVQGEHVRLSPFVAERLGRWKLIGPKFFSDLRFSSSDLSDLRLRRETSARRLLWNDLRLVAGLDAIRAALLVPTPVNRSAIIRLAADDPEMLHQYAACYVDSLNAWDEVAGWARVLEASRASWNCAADGGHLAAAMGSTLAVVGDQGGRALLQAAAESAEEPWDAFFFAFRLLTAELKRYEDRDRYASGRAWIEGFIAEFDCPDDVLAATAITDNLEALRHVLDHELGPARDLCKQLFESTSDLAPSLPSVIWSRYRSTMGINWVSTSASLAEPDSALAALDTVSSVLLEADENSRAELAGLRALLKLRVGRTMEALTVAQREYELGADEGNPVRRREMARIAAVAAADLALQEDARIWLEIAARQDQLLTVDIDS